MRLLLAAALLCGCGSALHDAAKRDDAQAIKRGIAEGLDPNQYSEGTGVYSPLYYAASRGNDAAAKALLDGGADPLRATSTRTGSQIATKFGHPETAALIAAYERRAGKAAAPARTLSKTERRYTEALAARNFYLALCLAADEGWTDKIAEAVAAGADPKAKDPGNGNSIFVCTVEHDRPESVRALVAAGADPAQAFEGTSYGASASERARLMGRSGVARAFVEARSEHAAARRQPGNLDDDAYDRMRASAGMPPEKKEPVSDVDLPKSRAPQRPDDFALVIGIEEYQSLPKADYGARDAKTVRRHLEALGFPPRNIISLEGPQATGNKLKSYLKEWLPINVKPESMLFVYYSGHGAPDPRTGDAYLVPWDGDASFLKSTAYPLKKFYADLGKTKAKRVIVALDACFSGAGGRSVLAQGARPLVAKVDDGVPVSERLTVLAAASGEEITGSLNEQGHGMFTYFFLKGLSEGKTTTRQLHDFLSPRVQDEARRQNRQQTPQLLGNDASF